MSDLATHAKLARSNAQLPVNVYFDEALAQREMQQLFQNGPRYLGHQLMVPETGDFATLASEHEGRMLVRNATGRRRPTVKAQGFVPRPSLRIRFDDVEPFLDA